MGPPKNLYQIIGKRIRAEREKAGWSQEILAEKADLNRNYVGEIERAEKRITLETLWQIANAFELHLTDFVDGL